MKKKAFTLVELMGILTIISVLALILIPVVNNMMQDNKDDVYNKQLELIKLSAKNLVTDNQYILPEEEGEEIFITLGQLRTMGYAEEKIINPLTNENFSDNLIVMIIKTEKDYTYEVDVNGGDVIESSGITVSQPSKMYIKQGVQSSYIITSRYSSVINDIITDYYITIEQSNIVLKGDAFGNDVKYKLEGNKGLYKLIILGGEKEGHLYFNFDNLKDIDTTNINNEIDNVNNNKQIIVDNTAPSCSWSGENTTWRKESVSITVSGSDSGSGMKSGQNTKTWSYTSSDVEIKTDTQSYVISDNVGNTTTCSKTFNVYYDTKAPQINSTNNPTNGNWVNYDFAVSVTATENGSGLSNYEPYSYDNSTWHASSWTINGNTLTTTDFVSERNNTVYLKVCDKLNNCSQTSTAIKIDKTDPTIKSVTQGSCSSDKRQITINATDNLSGIYGYAITTNDVEPTSYTQSSNTSWTSSAQTIGTYYVWVKDNTGNVSKTSTTLTTCDTVAPIIIDGNINNWVCGKCRTDKTYSGIKNYCALDDNDNCIETKDNRYGNTVGKVTYTISDNKVTFNWEIRQGKATYIADGYWVKFIIKDTSNNSVVKEFYLKESTGIYWNEGTKHTGTVEYSFTNKGTYKIYIDGNSNNPSFDMDFGTITVK